MNSEPSAHACRFIERVTFSNFEHSNICYESKRVDKNHPLTYKTYLSINIRKIEGFPRLLSKPVSAQRFYFGQKTTFRNVSAIKYWQ